MRKELFQDTDDHTSLALHFGDDGSSKSKLKAGFSTRHNGVSKEPFASLNLGFHVPDHSLDVLTNRKILSNKLDTPLEHWVVAEQIHGNEIAHIRSADKGRGATEHDSAIPSKDGLYTDEKGIMLGALYADCVPLFFYSPSAERVGIAHAGWKGTTKDIAGEMIQRWQEDGIDPKDILTAIGPSIGSCCYEVDDRVIESVIQVAFDSEQFFTRNENDTYQLDLKAVNKHLFLKAGVPENNIFVSDYCTSCSNLFFSHRSENGKTGRMMGYIGLEEG
ncbi:peptidoglycan editing factor PgeF [Guptibacillus algicola]|uniref:peptidoglycan editing factor PgeF n=1 Tax=Guptibacillus algicola TaxID=225844 RepID=UPI001CD46759|nr:peptidoglycan editing factor PgeF [Alkalihalobacillus algicola]MCA0987993.1 peptidoglycan editing factor PgeF [Alkalihalobacillus algicola]